MGDVAHIFSRQLHYVCGKGGVGKSVVSCALARAFVQQGHRVLLVQVNAADSHARLLGTSAVGPELREEPRDKSGGILTVVNATPAAAMKEYALLTLKFEAIYRTVFENRLTKAFLRFVPALAELTIQGKIWHHAEERVGDRPRFDRIVVDCPSTGHGVKFLRTAQIVRDGARIGPMAEKTRLMAAVVADPNRTVLHVVALPEELPVNEAKDLVAQVESTRTAPRGAVFFNQRLTPLFDESARAALAAVRAPSDDGALAQLLEVAVRRQRREESEAKERARLDTLEMPVVELPLVLASPLGRAEIDTFAALIVAAQKQGAR